MVVGSAAVQAQTSDSSGAGRVDPGHPRVNQINRRDTRLRGVLPVSVAYGRGRGACTLRVVRHRSEPAEAHGQRPQDGKLTPRQTARLEHSEQRRQNHQKKDLAKDQRPSQQTESAPAQSRIE
jgi:hypothetical protein